MANQLKPGTCVTFKNFSEKNKHMNNMLGLVKKQLENGHYRVMVTSGEFQIHPDKMVAVKQCPNEPQVSKSSAFIMWPEIVRSEFPCLQWIDSQELREICSDYMVAMGSSRYPIELTVEKLEQARKNCDKLSQFLKKNLGWKSPAHIKLLTSEKYGSVSDEHTVLEVFIMHDAESTAKNNKFLENFIKTNNSINHVIGMPNFQNLERSHSIKGPFLHFFRYAGTQSNTGVIKPFSSSAEVTKTVQMLNLMTSLNVFAMRFKLSFRKNWSTECRDEQKQAATMNWDKTGSCDGPCGHCEFIDETREMMKVQEWKD
jgi:hypothetical protein